MPLNYQDQVGLLKDILSDHHADCCGTVSECEQLERLVKALMANTNIHQNVKIVLKEIYDYSRLGIKTPDLESHVESNQQRLFEWISDIDQFS